MDSGIHDHVIDSSSSSIHISGFSKDQLKVQVEPSGSLKVSGERAVDGGGGGGGGRQWCHFTKRVDLPAGFDVVNDAAAITVQLDKGMLYIQVPRRQSAAWWGTEQQPAAAAEVYEDALRGESDETSDDGHGHGHGGGWNIGRVAARRDDGEHHPLRRLARGVSRHRQVVLNVVLAVVLLWLVVFAKND
jgi:hypothetical protein